jgi:hypothetical protein
MYVCMHVCIHECMYYRAAAQVSTVIYIERFSSIAAKSNRQYATPWDASKQVGCMCDPGWRGPSCELQVKRLHTSILIVNMSVCLAHTYAGSHMHAFVCTHRNVHREATCLVDLATKLVVIAVGEVYVTTTRGSARASAVSMAPDAKYSGYIQV